MHETLPPKTVKHYFLTGLFILIPVGLTLSMVGWLVQVLDGLFGALLTPVIGFRIPGLGLLLTIGVLIVVGMLVSGSAFVKQVFELFEEVLLHIPGVRAVYKTAKALTDVFSPENQKAFRNVVLVEYPHPGTLSIGFATSHVALSGEGAPSEPCLAVYVPSNHLYIGNTIIVPESKVRFTPMTVQEGIQTVLSSGASLPATLRTTHGAPPIVTTR